jgi:hypothetical protein
VTPAPDDPLRGKRILIVEDSFLVAQDLAAAVNRCGCEVLGPVASATKAYSDDAPLSEPLGQVRLLRKPVDPETLCATMRAEFAGQSPPR